MASDSRPIQVAKYKLQNNTARMEKEKEGNSAEERLISDQAKMEKRPTVKRTNCDGETESGNRVGKGNGKTDCKMK